MKRAHAVIWALVLCLVSLTACASMLERDYTVSLPHQEDPPYHAGAAYRVETYTALRSARLIVADFLRIGQKTVRARLAISLPLFAVTAGILVWSLSDPKGFQTLWRYFAWSNQTLSVFTLWAITVCLMRHGRLFWVTYLPAAFMTMVCSAYILVADEGLGLSYALGLILSAVVTLAVAGGFLGWHLRSKRKP